MDRFDLLVVRMLSSVLHILCARFHPAVAAAALGTDGYTALWRHNCVLGLSWRSVVILPFFGG